jgi:hypothetical protein
MPTRTLKQANIEIRHLEEDIVTLHGDLQHRQSLYEAIEQMLFDTQDIAQRLGRQLDVAKAALKDAGDYDALAEIACLESDAGDTADTDKKFHNSPT